MRTAFALAALVLLSNRAVADDVTIVPSRDVTLYENATGALANGAGEFIFSGRTGPNNNFLIRRAVLFFDVAGSVPAGATVTNVSLQLSLTRSNGTPTDFTLHRASTNWGEGTSNAGDPGGAGTASTNGDATWQHTFFPGSTWTTLGGDFDPTPSATTTVGTTIQAYNWTSPQMANDVQNWLSSPAMNFGWFLVGNETTGPDASRFASRENLIPSQHPVLMVTFTPIPEPSAMLVIGFAVVGLAMRRRSR